MKKLYLLLSILILFSQCATIVSRKTYNIGINCHPQNAKVKVSNLHGEIVYNGLTPILLPLASSSNPFEPEIYSIEFSKEGFFKASYILQPKLNYWLLGDFFILLPIDIITNHTYRVYTEYIQADLLPLSSGNKTEIKTANPPLK